MKGLEILNSLYISKNFHYGVEFTFVPNKGKEFLDFSEATECANEFNRELFGASLDYMFKAKADLFRALFRGQKYESYCIEVNNVSPLIYTIENPYPYKLSVLFDIAKKLKLVARPKCGNKYWPNGGAHIHLSTGFIEDSPFSLDILKLFSDELNYQYAMRPYIRWMFADWFENNNSFCITTISDSNNSLGFKVCDAHGIVRRFFGAQKNTYPSYEFRFFRMVNNPEEFELHIRFLAAFKEYCMKSAFTDNEDHSKRYLSVNKVVENINNFRNIAYTKSAVKEFFDLLGLDFSAYLPLFNENLVLRLKYGELK